MEKHYPRADVAPQTLSDLVGDPLAPRPVGGQKRNKAKAKAQRQARKRNR